MSFSRRACAILAALAALLAAAPAAAADAALNKEGFWTVGRDDADAKGCMASIFARDGTMLLIQVQPRHVDFVVVGKNNRPVRRGKKGVLTMGADNFGFGADYLDGMLLFEDVEGRALATLRTAQSVTIQLDGRRLLQIDVENTGVAEALDAASACSRGKSGWWGPGVAAERISDGPVPNKSADHPVANKEGVWSIAASEEPGICVAQAPADDHRHLQMLAAGGRVGLAVGSDGEDLPRGRKGRVETDAYAFDFKPQYGADSYVAADQPFDSQALLALARAKWIRVTVDRRELVDVSLEGSGFAELLTSVAACSRGEKGWWGEGASVAR